MIHRASVAVVLDANMLLPIAKDHASEDLNGALRAWAGSMVRGAEPPPRGKIMTVLVTNRILHDYWTGLSRGGYRVDRDVKRQFRAYTGKTIQMDRRRDVRFGVMVVQEKPGLGRIDVGDRYDRPYPRLLLTVAGERKWSDRHVIFGSRDAKMLGITRDMMLRRAPAGRFHFAASRADFEDIIMC